MTDGDLDLPGELRRECREYHAMQGNLDIDKRPLCEPPCLYVLAADAIAAYRTREQQARALPEEFRRCATLAATSGVVAAFRACADSLEAIYAKEAAS